MANVPTLGVRYVRRSTVNINDLILQNDKRKYIIRIRLQIREMV